MPAQATSSPGSQPSGCMPFSSEAAALLEMQRQQAESQYLAAWQNYTHIAELSRVAMMKAEVTEKKQVEEQKTDNKDEKIEEKTPDSEEKQAAMAAKTTSAELPRKDQEKVTVPVEPVVKHGAQEPVPATEATRTILRIRKVGTLSTGDGCLEIYARYTPLEDKDRVPVDKEIQVMAANPLPETKPPEAGDAQFLRPKPKKMPATALSSGSKVVKEPPYPP